MKITLLFSSTETANARLFLEDGLEFGEFFRFLEGETICSLFSRFEGELVCLLLLFIAEAEEFLERWKEDLEGVRLPSLEKEEEESCFLSGRGLFLPGLFDEEEGEEEAPVVEIFVGLIN